ncbi:MAG: tetratricopeptide repeat protein [Psychrobium sp.]|nr:tetratricopeptide repeat protein [Psychrobium sp.]
MFEDSELGNANSIARFYIRHKNYDGAISVYNKMAVANPTEAKIENALGDVYITLKENKSAKRHYKNAVTLTKASKNNKLSAYQKKLNAL